MKEFIEFFIKRKKNMLDKFYVYSNLVIVYDREGCLVNVGSGLNGDLRCGRKKKLIKKSDFVCLYSICFCVCIVRLFSLESLNFFFLIEE